MADQFRINYDEVQQVVSRFSNQAQAVQKIIDAVRGSYGPLEEGKWKGTAADAFFAEMTNVVFPSATRLQQALEEGSRAAAEVLQIGRTGEEEASAVFNRPS